MTKRNKVLLLDDDADLLELYRELFAKLPSKPEIYTASSPARALNLLESGTFDLLISDLRMPKMDGLQVLTIVRKKFPQLRTAILSAAADQQFRTRAYAVGVDLFLDKPHNSREMQFLLDCIESLLSRDQTSGFRGIQSKSLVDIIQLECLSQSSSLLKFSNGLVEGKIWILNGEVVDAQTGDLSGEPAFHKILSWKTGNFETLPPDPDRARAIFGSYQALLLETAQALDEAATPTAPGSADSTAAAPRGEPINYAQFQGLESVLVLSAAGETQSWGLENPEILQDWTRLTMDNFRALGEHLQAGPLKKIEGSSSERKILLSAGGEKTVGLSFHLNASPETMNRTLQNILALWAS